MTIERYMGIGKEVTYGVAKAPAFHVNILSGGLDSPAKPFLEYEGGLGSFPTEVIPGPYITKGAIEHGATVSTLWYLLWLCFGYKETEDSGVTAVVDEVLGTTDAVTGDLAGTLAEFPACPESIVLKNEAGAIIGQDDGSGRFRAAVAVTSDTIVTGAGETTATKTLTTGGLRVIPFSYSMTETTLKAHDDGAGVIVADGGSGIAGTIDYITGIVTLTGLTAEKTYTLAFMKLSTTVKGTIDYITGDFSLTDLTPDNDTTGNYNYGSYVHTITMPEIVNMLSATIGLGKDYYEHQFVGCALDSLDVSVDTKGLMKVTGNWVGGADSKETIKTVANLRFSPEVVRAFHNIQFKYSDYGVTLADISWQVDSMALSIKMNADAEGGLGLNSRFTQRIYAGKKDITMKLDLKFEDTANKEDYWGSASAPTETPTYKVIQITIDGGDYGNIVIDIPRSLINSVPHQPKGRERMKESLELAARIDPLTSTYITATCTALTNYL